MAMAYTTFHENQFRRQVDKALKTVATILDVNRTPKYAQDQDHKYDDKYDLTNLMTNTAIAANMNLLERMGLDESKLRKLIGIVHVDKRSVTLRLAAHDTCSFLKEQDVSVVSPHQVEHTVETTETNKGLFGSSKKEKTFTSKVTTKVREYHWKVGVVYRLFCFAGNDPDKDPIELQSRASSTVIITKGTKKAPLPESTIRPFVDVNLTWLLQQISADKKQLCRFQIDRSDPDKCRTPRRNEQVDDALEFFHSYKQWASKCCDFMQYLQLEILGKHDPADGATTPTVDLGCVDPGDIFCPIMPLMEPPRDLAGTATREEESRSLVQMTSPSTSEASPLLSAGDIDKFLNEHIRQLDDTSARLSEVFPSIETDKIVTVAEGTLVLLWDQVKRMSTVYEDCVDYVENMLRKQLIAAIGKVVHPDDFDKFIRFHGKKFFGPMYTPRPFCYAIRRPEHYPDGVLNIEGNDKMEPIETTVRFMEDGPSMYIPINAATSVEFTGQRYLHGWIRHKFDSAFLAKAGDCSPCSAFNLTARARQFSSFLVMVGTISGPTQFTPKDAIILQNKDEVIIPLLLNELPTAKEFKDAISSLSPEQQRFAKSFRGMQLESSVFGVCVVQLKPQLEVLLGLPPDALTKEIRLTQDLMSLFIDYQIPSDLLSFDGAPDAAVAEKVGAVKEHVKAVMAVIEEAKQKQLDDAEKAAEMAYYGSVEMEESEKAHPPQGMSSRGGGAWARARGIPRAYMAMEDAAPIFGDDAGPEVSTSAMYMKALAPASAQQMQRVSTKRERKLAVAGTAAPPLEDMQASLQNEAPAPSESVPVSGKRPHSSLETHVEDLGSPDALASTGSPNAVDFTAIPKQLDAKFDVHDTDSSLRATIIETQKNWKRMRQDNLLTKPRQSNLSQTQIKSEKEKAFDLLDALSRSGSLPVACAELHVVVAVTHCFEKDVMETVIQDNVNPIEKVEKTMLLMASTIHDVAPGALIEDHSQSSRLMESFPALFAAPEDGGTEE